MTTREIIETEAARWILRQEEPGWTAADQVALDGWLDASTAHQAAYWRLEDGWRKADRLAAHRTAPAPLPAAKPRTAQRFWRPGAIAASLLAVAAVTGWWAIGEAPRKSYATEVGGHQTVPLPDGTRLELNTDTRLRSVVTDARREVWLERGEAYFEVAHDPSRPFVIHAGDRKVTVLGTKFSVRRDGDRVQVSVLEGKVRVDAVHPPSPLPPTVLTQGQIAIARGSEALVAPRTIERVEGELSWRHGMLTFDQYTVARAAEEFNRYNKRKIIITDPQAGAIRIGGTFQSNNIDGFVELLEQGYGLRIESGPEEIRISS